MMLWTVEMINFGREQIPRSLASQRTDGDCKARPGQLPGTIPAVDRDIRPGRLISSHAQWLSRVHFEPRSELKPDTPTYRVEVVFV